MTFLVDAQLPPALAGMLREAGHEALHVEDAGLRHASDAQIWKYALAHDVVVVTKDEDFAVRSLLGPPRPQIVWIRIGNSSRQSLLKWFSPLIDSVASRLDQGEPVIEIR